MTEPETLLQHAAFLRGLARGLLGDSDRAGDVVQQTWLAALEKGPRTPDKARAWLATTLRNFVRMSYRGQSRRRQREKVAARPERVVATDSIAEKTELQRRVADAVHHLEEPYRATIVLRYLEEHSTAEIARRQGVPVKTVQTRLRRGLELLRGRLDTAYGGDRKKWALLLVPLAWPSSASAATAAVTTGTFWIMLMKPKIIIPLLFALVLGSSLLARATWQPDRSDVERRDRTGPKAVASNDPAPTAPEVDKPPVVQPGEFLLRGIVRNREGVAIAGAAVTPGSYVNNEHWQSTGSTVTTDNTGAFSVSVARDTGTGVSVIHPDYVPQRAWIEPAPADPEVVTLHNGVRMAIRVLSPDLLPVAGARVDISHQQQEQPGTWSIEDIASATTGTDGHVEVVRVPKGHIAVLVAHEQFAEHGAHFDIEGDSEQTIVLKIGGTIVGRVLDQRGKPLAGAKVRNTEDEEDDGVLTDGAGRFRLQSLTPGWVELEASARGYGAASFGSAHGWHEATPVRVRDRETTRGIELILHDPTWLSGRVVDELGAPLKDFPVEAYADGEVTTTTDEKGRFRMALGISGTGTATVSFRSRDRWQLDGISAIELREGEVRDLGDLRAVTMATLSGRVVDERGEPVTKGWVATASNLVSLRGGRFTMGVRPGPQQIRIRAQSNGRALVATARRKAAPGEHIEDLVFTVKRAGVIRGRLVGTDGGPVDRRWVMAVRVGSPMPAPRTLHASTVVSGDGSFTLAVQDTGEYRVGLFEPAGGKGMAHFAANPPPAIVKPGADPITLVVPLETAIVSGRVLSGSTRRPLEYYNVRLVEFRDGLPWHYAIITARDRDGRFRFNDAKGGAKYALEIFALKHGLYRSEVFTLERGQTLSVPDIVLPAHGHVQGRVVDADGRPVPFARISILGPNLATNLTRPVTDSEGRFDPFAFAPGEHQLVAFIPTRGLGLATVRIEPGHTTEVEITLPSTAPLLVIVRDAAGRPAANVPVTFRADSIAPLTSEHMFRLYLHGYPGQSYRTDARGELRIAYLPAGEARISVGGDSKNATLVAGSETKVEFQLDE